MFVDNILNKFQNGSLDLFHALKPILNWEKANMTFTFTLVSTGKIHPDAETDLCQKCLDCFDRETAASFFSVQPHFVKRVTKFKKEKLQTLDSDQ
jgi:hypothetical protein